MRASIALSLLILSACTFPELPPIDVDAAVDAASDSAADAADGSSTACEPNSIVCDDVQGHYVECSGTGSIAFDMDCPLGCAAGVEKCLDVDPSNGVAQYLDMAAPRSDSIAVTFPAGSAIFGDGTIAVGAAPPQTVAFARLADDTLVHMFKSLTVPDGVTLRVAGAYPVILVVDGPVEIAGSLRSVDLVVAPFRS